MTVALGAFALAATPNAGAQAPADGRAAVLVGLEVVDVPHRGVAPRRAADSTATASGSRTWPNGP